MPNTAQRCQRVASELNDRHKSTPRPAENKENLTPASPTRSSSTTKTVTPAATGTVSFSTPEKSPPRQFDFSKSDVLSLSPRSPSSSPTKSPPTAKKTLCVSPNGSPIRTPIKSSSSSSSPKSRMPGTPPRSPMSRSSSGGPRLPRTPDSKTKKKTAPQIAQFYFPNGAPLSPNSKEQEAGLIDRVFAQCADADQGLSEADFLPVTTVVCGLTSFCNECLFRRIVSLQPECQAANRINKASFLKFWAEHFQKVDVATRYFRTLKPPDNKNVLTESEFRPMVAAVVERHPGLEFLKSAPAFHERYIDTVLGRIMYHVDTSVVGSISLKDLKRSNLVDTIGLLDEEADINEIFDYFSYEHFYVIYCKFWELDTDHDFVIDRNGLLSYGECTLTAAVVDRILSGAARKLPFSEPGTMAFKDFIPFIISVEDKTSDVALNYWFRVLDLDGDGIIAPFETEHFYREQRTRIERLSNERVLFEDYLCQLNDMIKPKHEARFSRKELKASGLHHLFFNMLFDINKFALHESRDPYVIEEKRATPQMTDWDRFASMEYAQYSEEDSRDEGDSEVSADLEDNFSSLSVQLS